MPTQARGTWPPRCKDDKMHHMAHSLRKMTPFVLFLAPTRRSRRDWQTGMLLRPGKSSSTQTPATGAGVAVGAALMGLQMTLSGVEESVSYFFFVIIFNNIFCFSSHSFIHHTMLTVTASGRPLWLSRRPIRLQERVRKSHLPLGCEQIPGIRAGSCRFRLIDGRQEERADSCDQPRRPRWKRSAVCCVGGRGALGKDERRCH